MSPITLRPYQIEGVRAVLDTLDGPPPEGHAQHHLLVSWPTGLGKTVFFSGLSREFLCGRPTARVMIVAHRDELIGQAVAKYRMVDPSVRIGVIQAGQHDVAGNNVIVASVQSMNAARLARLGEWRPDLLIVDECFPAGTLVGGRPIESIRPGDLVPSYDESTGDVVDRRVIRTMSKAPASLVRVTLSDGRTFTCTPNHPLLTSNGWCTAGLSRGALVLSFTHDAHAPLYSVLDTVRGDDRPGREHAEDRQPVLLPVLPEGGSEREMGRSPEALQGSALRVVRDAVPGAERSADQTVPGDGSGLLLRSLSGRLGEPGVVRADGQDESCPRFGADALEQSDGQAGCASGHDCHAAGDRASAQGPRREREVGPRTTEGTGRVPGVADRSFGGSDGRGASVSLQVGHLSSDNDGLRGSGRGVPFLAGAPRVGRSQGRSPGWARVVDVQVLEPGRDGTYGGVCSDGAVYNLEVEGTQTYLIGNGLVVHNCHHAAARSYKRLIEWAECPVVGVTATPVRGDGKALARNAGGVFDRIVHERSLLWAIRNRFLCDVRGVRIVVDDLDLAAMKSIGGDYSEKEVGERLLGSSAPKAATQAIREHGQGLPGIIFAPTVETAHVFTEAMREAGFSCETVWGAMPKQHDQLDAFGQVVQKSRRRILQEYNAGKIDWLSNCLVLTEGFDSPRAKVAVIARPTQSASLYQQMIGRILRPFPGANIALVLDIVGASRQHELAAMNSLVGEEAKDVEPRETLLDLYGAPCDFCDRPRDECEWREEEPCCERCTHATVAASALDSIREVEGPLRAVDADLFGGSRQQWLATEAGYWFLATHERLIAVAPRADSESDAGDYDVIWTWVAKRGGGYLHREVADLSTGMMLGEGEITPEEEQQSRKDASWRKRRATDKQIGLAKALGAYRPGMEDMRAGAVSDAISVRKASARLDKMITARLEQS